MKAVPFSSFSRLRFENLSFSYEGSEHSIFEDISCELPLGKNVFVGGDLGSGQSTLLKLLAVLVQPQSGRILVNDHDVTAMSFEEFLSIRMKIGYAFDYGGLFANRTLHDNLTLPLIYHKRCSDEEAHEKVDLMARDFDFYPVRNQRPAMVSGGLRKLICVLRSFILQPEMVILDDPFTGIGAVASRKLVRFIQDLRDQGSLQHVFLTSRDEVWPHWIGCDSLLVSRSRLDFEQRKSA